MIGLLRPRRDPPVPIGPSSTHTPGRREPDGARRRPRCVRAAGPYTYEHQDQAAPDYETSGRNAGPKTARLTGAETPILGPLVAGMIVPVPGPVAQRRCDFASGADCLPSEAATHIVGTVRTAPDGTLFITIGDASESDELEEALRTQNPDILAGKVLRLTSARLYRPAGPVPQAQAVSFVTHAMVARGYWTLQADDPARYPNVPAASGHHQDLVTFLQYAGPVPGTIPTVAWPGWDQSIGRSGFAATLWQALDSYCGVDEAGRGGFVP